MWLNPAQVVINYGNRLLEAEVIVTRSSGETVELKVNAVDRQKRLVTIIIAEYNAQFIFSDKTGKIALVDNGRQKIDENEPATEHVSQTVYAAMVKWAIAILKDRR